MPQVTAAPFPVKIGEYTYEMSPFSDRDIDEINNWMRASYIQMARDSLVPGMSREEREETLGVAMTRARKLSFLEGEGAEIAGSLDGACRVMWQGFRRKQPELSWEVFKNRVWKLKELNENELAKDMMAVMRVWKEINVGETVADKDNTEGEDTEKKILPPAPTSAPST
jgi:hypothetical protein